MENDTIVNVYTNLMNEYFGITKKTPEQIEEEKQYQIKQEELRKQRQLKEKQIKDEYDLLISQITKITFYLPDVIPDLIKLKNEIENINFTGESNSYYLNLLYQFKKNKSNEINNKINSIYFEQYKNEITSFSIENKDIIALKQLILDINKIIINDITFNTKLNEIKESKINSIKEKIKELENKNLQDKINEEVENIKKKINDADFSTDDIIQLNKIITEINQIKLTLLTDNNDKRFIEINQLKQNKIDKINTKIKELRKKQTEADKQKNIDIEKITIDNKIKEIEKELGKINLDNYKNKNTIKELNEMYYELMNIKIPNYNYKVIYEDNKSYKEEEINTLNKIILELGIKLSEIKNEIKIKISNKINEYINTVYENKLRYLNNLIGENKLEDLNKVYNDESNFNIDESNFNIDEINIIKDNKEYYDKYLEELETKNNLLKNKKQEIKGLIDKITEEEKQKDELNNLFNIPNIIQKDIKNDIEIYDYIEPNMIIGNDVSELIKNLDNFNINKNLYLDEDKLTYKKFYELINKEIEDAFTTTIINNKKTEILELAYFGLEAFLKELCEKLNLKYNEDVVLFLKGGNLFNNYIKKLTGTYKETFKMSDLDFQININNNFDINKISNKQQYKIEKIDDLYEYFLQQINYYLLYIRINGFKYDNIGGLSKILKDALNDASISSQFITKIKNNLEENIYTKFNADGTFTYDGKNIEYTEDISNSLLNIKDENGKKINEGMTTKNIKNIKIKSIYILGKKIDLITENITNIDINNDTDINKNNKLNKYKKIDEKIKSYIPLSNGYELKFYEKKEDLIASKLIKKINEKLTNLSYTEITKYNFGIAKYTEVSNNFKTPELKDDNSSINYIDDKEIEKEYKLNYIYHNYYNNLIDINGNNLIDTKPTPIYTSITRNLTNETNKFLLGRNKLMYGFTYDLYEEYEMKTRITMFSLYKENKLELIDISIPTNNDYYLQQFFKEDTSNNINKLSYPNNIIKLEYNGGVINILSPEYILYDLYNTLGKDKLTLFIDPKYKKRLTRMIYIIILLLYKNKYYFNIKTKKDIKNIFDKYIDIDKIKGIKLDKNYKIGDIIKYGDDILDKPFFNYLTTLLIKEYILTGYKQNMTCNENELTKELCKDYEEKNVGIVFTSFRWQGSEGLFGTTTIKIPNINSNNINRIYASKLMDQNIILDKENKNSLLKAINNEFNRIYYSVLENTDNDELKINKIFNKENRSELLIGGYYNKYLKYKLKYELLKKELGIN